MTVAIPAAKTKFWLTKNPITTLPATPLSISAITKAKPAVLTVTGSTLTVGQLVYISGTGFPELDNRFFTLKAATATSLTLAGSDTTGSSGTITTATAKVYDYDKATDLVQICVSSFTKSGGTRESVSVGTFCDPSATIPGTESAGSITFNGYMDPTEAGYLGLVDAADDGGVYGVMVELPDSKGAIVMSGTFGGMSEDFTLGQGISYSIDMGLATKATYAF